MTVLDLSISELWWHGPQFLQRPEAEWPENKFKPDIEVKCESKVKSELSFTTFFAIQENDKTESFRLKPENYSS